MGKAAYRFAGAHPLFGSRLLAILIGNVLDRYRALALCGREYDHPLGRAPRDADVLDRHADQLTAIGDEHDLVGLLDGEGADQFAVPLVDDHGDDAFAAAARDAVFVVT